MALFMYTNMDLQVTKQALIAKAEATGVYPLAVQLVLPDRQDVAWSKLAADHLMAVAKAKHFGIRPPSVLTPTEKLDEEYERLSQLTVSLQDLMNSTHEADDVADTN